MNRRMLLLATSATVRMMTSSTSQTASPSHGLIFEKAGGGTALAYTVSRTRKQVEQARNTALERVYIAAG